MPATAVILCEPPIDLTIPLVERWLTDLPVAVSTTPPHALAATLRPTFYPLVILGYSAAGPPLATLVATARRFEAAIVVAGSEEAAGAEAELLLTLDVDAWVRRPWPANRWRALLRQMVDAAQEKLALG